MTEAVTVRRALESSGLVPIDAQVLLARVLGMDRTWLAAHPETALDAGQAHTFFGLSNRRREGEPVAYLTGIREFWGLPIQVTPAVLIPRPETETLVEVALASLPAERATRVLDLGTGSGAIALAIAHERPLAQILATDISTEALAVAADNARRLGLHRIEFVPSSWFSGVTENFHGARFDLIVSNPPYIEAGDRHLAEGDLRYEPSIALSPGVDGLAALRAIVAGAGSRLTVGGTLAVEHGFDQEDAVRSLFAAAGFAEIASARDLAGVPRVMHARFGRAE